MSVYQSLALMFAFSTFILTLIKLIIELMKLNNKDNKK